MDALAISGGSTLCVMRRRRLEGCDHDAYHQMVLYTIAPGGQVGSVQSVTLINARVTIRLQ